jgi:hypothetical protein
MYWLYIIQLSKPTLVLVAWIQLFLGMNVNNRRLPRVKFQIFYQYYKYPVNCLIGTFTSAKKYPKYPVSVTENWNWKQWQL